jgi:hypothetical protein
VTVKIAVSTVTCLSTATACYGQIFNRKHANLLLNLPYQPATLMHCLLLLLLLLLLYTIWSCYCFWQLGRLSSQATGCPVCR